VFFLRFLNVSLLSNEKRFIIGFSVFVPEQIVGREKNQQLVLSESSEHRGAIGSAGDGK